MGWRLKSLLCLAFFIGSVLFFSDPSAAQSDRVGIQIAPLIFEYTARPNEELVGQMLVFNPLEDSQEIEIKTWDFVQADEKGALRFFEGLSEYSASQWIAYQPTKLSLAPQEQVVVPFVIFVPEQTLPGTYTAVVFAQAEIQPELETYSIEPEKGSKVNVAAGSLFLVDVITEDSTDPGYWTGEILEVKLKGVSPILGLPVFWVKDEIVGVVRFKNTGLYQQQVLGKAKVTNVIGREIDWSVSLNQRVLPRTVLQFHFPWSPKILLGRYQFTVNFNYGRGHQFEESETISLWAINALGLGVLALFSFVMLGLYWRWRRKKENHDQRDLTGQGDLYKTED
jgi:hypothetical protein